jgi:hypothetical protein
MFGRASHVVSWSTWICRRPPMFRLKLFLAPLLLVAITPMFHGQVAYPNGVQTQAGITAQPERFPPSLAWKAATDPNPNYPLRIKLQFDRNRYDGLSYVGRGTAEILAPQASSLSFKYACDLPLSNLGDLQARWTTPGSKIEVLLQKPGTSHTRTCSIHVHS